MNRFKFLLYFLCCSTLLLGCTRTNRYSRANTVGVREGSAYLKNTQLPLDLSFPGDYKVENRVPYQEYRAAKELLPHHFRAKYSYLLYKASATDPDFTHYTWRIPKRLLNLEALAELPQWEKRNNYLYAIDTSALTSTALMVAIYPGQTAHYLFLVRAPEEATRPLPFKTEQMKEEYFEILDSIKTQ